MSIPDSLRDPVLVPLWRSCRQRLDRYGPHYRGSMQLPDLLDRARLTLDSLLDKPCTSRVDLAALEDALISVGVASDLSQALTRLGAAENTVLAAKRVAAEQRKNARAAINAEIPDWPEVWPQEWVSWLFRSGAMSGTSATDAVALIRQVRELIDHIQAVDDSLSRNDLAATLFGSAHALDDGSVLERCARRALWHRLDQSLDYSQGRLIWNAAGIMTDRVSVPVLTWRLKLLSKTPLGKLCDAANAARIPLHLSLAALTEHDIVSVASSQPILVVENPRLLEVAADRQLHQTVIATNGNPSAAVTTLLQALIEQGRQLHYHGDFDAAGIAICHRLAKMGCQPWRMSGADYIAAIDKARAMAITLPEDDGVCGETPWDPSLQRVMRKHGAVVHEEFLIDELLA